AGTGVVRGNTVNLSSLVGGQIGLPGLRIVADFCNANSSGDVHINSQGTGPITFTSVTGGGSFFQVLAHSAIVVTGAINAPRTMTLEVLPGSNGGITIDAAVGTTTSTTQVIAGGNGNIITGAGGIIQGSSVTVSSVGGNIGTSSAPVLLAAGSLTLNSGGLTNVSNSY